MTKPTEVLATLAGVLVLGTTGCVTRLGDMTVLSTRNVTLSKVDLDRMPQVKGITGRDSKFIILCIPLGIPHLEDAVDEALNKGGGDVMVDAVVHQEGWWFLVGQTALTVKGSVVNTRGTRQ
jgi:hypothetical protein